MSTAGWTKFVCVGFLLVLFVDEEDGKQVQHARQT